jgi:hypothetical protein
MSAVHAYVRAHVSVEPCVHGHVSTRVTEACERAVRLPQVQKGFTLL